MTIKARPNLAKHGIDFIFAQRLWNDPDVLEILGQKILKCRAILR